MAYPFEEIEKKWQQYWADHKTFRAITPSPEGEGRGEVKPKYYSLDMFPYPSGAGLHVGHPLGYIASDIVSRYKRLKGFNVLHPMGYDSFGLPAEQYAIQTGQHPEKTTQENIARYRQQMDKIGFSFDWDREVCTSDPNYYKWTQWIFLKLFNSWYNPETDKAESIETLIPKLKNFSSLSEKEKSDTLMNYRLAYLSEAWVNWCPQLGTVLANEEVKDGVSERGSYPVERKLMPQWSLRITSYAERLLNDLEKIDWSESIKESQRNWIGKSEGSSLKFRVESSKLEIEVFTTRPDTVFGVTFLTLAPESDLVSQLTTPEQKQKVEAYVHYAKNRSERDRQSDVKKVTGEFTGAYCIHPFTNEKIPVWIGEYVLASYGTGAVMGVPAHDTRDFAFAKHFGLAIKKVIQPNDKALEKEECFDTYDGFAINSDFINGLQVKEAIRKIISEIEKRNLGKGKTQYRLRDAIFGRQRYWGEPIPIYYQDGIPRAMKEEHLPLLLPEVDKYLPTESGEPPLARAKNWFYHPEKGMCSPSLTERGLGGEVETTTMPGWAGSSWYYLRYMDPQNKNEFVSKEAVNYWQNVDLYIGGSEHATGHLLYVRFWTKFLFNLGLIPITEPAKKLINQGMIQGDSRYIYRFYFELVEGETYFRDKPYEWFVSADLVQKYQLGNSQMASEKILKTIIDKSTVLKKNNIKVSYFSNFKFSLIPI
ncbi:MAG TPA: leucine--tRNA ligase, partial [Bacteroidia bacterium]